MHATDTQSRYGSSLNIDRGSTGVMLESSSSRPRPSQPTEYLALAPNTPSIQFAIESPFCQYFSEAHATHASHASEPPEAADPLPAGLVTVKRKRRPNDEQQREHIKQVRREGACVRCRVYKEKVIISKTVRRKLSFKLILAVRPSGPLWSLH